MKNEKDGLARLTEEEWMRAGVMIERAMLDPIPRASIDPDREGRSGAAQADKELFLFDCYGRAARHGRPDELPAYLPVPLFANPYFWLACVSAAVGLIALAIVVPKL